MSALQKESSNMMHTIEHCQHGLEPGQFMIPLRLLHYSACSKNNWKLAFPCLMIQLQGRFFLHCSALCAVIFSDPVWMYNTPIQICIIVQGTGESDFRFFWV